MKKKNYEEIFKKEYNRLNPAQKSAVDEIYGPVMAIAGPGTGKTQLLAVRVCNILFKTDMQPQNILCLTFTEAGVVAMRQRLLRFLGPDAYKVGIYTYHGFCNSVIKENAEYFDEYRTLNQADDLDQVEIVNEIIDELPLDHPLKRLKDSIYFDTKQYLSLFNTMKREGWTPQLFDTHIDQLIAEAKEDPALRYKVNTKTNKKGDIKVKELEKITKTLEKSRSASKLLDTYNNKLLERGLIDFNDSIINVISAFKESEDILYDYQERYQFVLADEYQDTNGTQNEILYLLGSYDIRPNLFVVGDDDQAIFRFQGANLNNILDFYKDFNPKMIVLDQNYRSYQGILDSAMNLIAQNQGRMGHYIPQLSKNLTESRIENKGVGAAPYLKKYKNAHQQEIDIVKQIQTLHQAGVPYNEMAVIYRQHKEVADIVKYLNYKDIPLNIKKSVNILKEIDVIRIIKILTYVYYEYNAPFSREEDLFEMLHYDYFHCDPRDIGLLSITVNEVSEDNDQRVKWRAVLADEEMMENIGVKKIGPLFEANQILESLIKDYPNVTMQVLFERLLTNANILGTIMNSKDRTWRNQIISSLFDFIKNKSAAYGQYELKDFLQHFSKMTEFDIPVQLNKIVSSNHGVNFLSAHGSKGLEFQHVFIINVNQKEWVKKNFNRGFKIPESLVTSDMVSDIEDDRRLFYVAITRAQEYVHLSFLSQGDNGKDKTPAVFLSELGLETEIDETPVDEDWVNDYLYVLLRFEQGSVDLIDRGLVDRRMDRMALNATGISKYLDCKLKFYFENILRVPQARDERMGYGNAVHYALEKFFIQKKKQPDLKTPTVETLLKYFKEGMDKFRSHFTKEQYTNISHHGNLTLTAYYNASKTFWDMQSDFKLEYPIATEIAGIPVSGNIDRIDLYNDHIDVIDYKTGKPKNGRKKTNGPKAEDDHGGDYWRQAVFYKMLLMNDPNNMWKPLQNSTMDFIEIPEDKKSWLKIPIKVTDGEITAVTGQLQHVWKGLQNHEFTPGCNKDECRWCGFVKKHMVDLG